MSEEGGDRVLVDIAAAFPNADERRQLIAWGAEYLNDAIGEDTGVRIGRLVLYYRDQIFTRARRRGQRLSFDQTNMTALAVLVATIRYRQETGGHDATRH